MNHIYRRVYNHARLCLASGVAMASPVVAQIVADPQAPGNQRPTVLGARGSAALINIQAPSAAGISRNTYSQLDVDQHGAVLNNSRTASRTRLAGTIAGNPWIGTRTAKVILNEVTGPVPSSLRGHIEVAGERAHVIVANPAGIHCDGCGVINASRLTLTTGTPMLSDGALDGYRVTGGSVRIDGAGLDATQADYTDIIARAVEVNGNIWSPELQVSVGANEPEARKADKPVFALDVGSLGGMYANKIVLLGTEHGVGVRNAGTIGAQAGDLVVTVNGRLENRGSLQAQANTAIRAGGGLMNSGSITAADQLTIATPAAIDNSDGALKAVRLVVEADALRNAGGSIVQTGAQGLSLQAGSVSNRGGSIGALRDSSPEVVAGTGAPAASQADGVLRIAERLDNDGGRIDAAGIDLTTADGLANAGGTLRLRRFAMTGGDLGNRGGTLLVEDAATLRARTVLNDAGRLNFADALVFSAAGFSNRDGKLMHAGDAPVTLSVAGTFDNSDGTIESRASQLTILSGALTNEGGTLLHTGSDGFMLRTGTWRGGAGKLIVEGAAVIAAGAVDHRGAALTARQMDLVADGLDNRGGSITLWGDEASTLTVAGTLDNGGGGTMAGNGGLTIRAGTLGNARGAVKQAGAGSLTIHADTLLGAGGSLVSGAALRLTGQAIDLSEGTTQAKTIRVSAASLSTARGKLRASGSDALELDLRRAYDNTAGSVGTNGALRLLAGSLTNAQGTLEAAGTEATTLRVGDRLDNTGGRIGASGDTTIHAATLDNTQGRIWHAGQGSLRIDAATLHGLSGELASGGALTLTGVTTNLREATTTARQVAIDTENLVTAGGRLRALGDGPATLNARGTFDNSAGAIAAHGPMTVRTPLLLNAGGSLVANALHVTLATWTGRGALWGANLLDVHVLGDYTHETGRQWKGDGVFSVKVDGTLTNQGILQTGGELNLAAAHLVNQGAIHASAAADGSARARLSVDGRIDNQAGASIAGDTVTLAAAHIDNTSREGITANVLRIAADTLTNGRDLGSADAAVAYGEGFIGAAQSLDLRVDRHLSNRDGEIYAGGDLVLAGRAEGSRTATLENLSGRIQAKGDARIAADVIVNRKRFIETAQVPLTPDEQHALGSERLYDDALTPEERQRVVQLFEKNGARRIRKRALNRYLRKKGTGGLTHAEMTELMSYLYRSGWVRSEHVSDADLAVLNTFYNRTAIDEYGTRGGYLVVGPDGNPGAAYKQVDTYLTRTRVVRESAASQISTGGNLAIDLGTRLLNHASAIAASGHLSIDSQAGVADARIENLAVKGHYTVRRDVDALVLPPVPVKYLSRRGWKDDLGHFSAPISTDTLTVEGPVLAPATITGRNVSLASHDIRNAAVAGSDGVTPLESAVPRRADGLVADVAPQVVGSVERPLPGFNPPSGGRVVRHADAGAPALITAVPRFANGNAISSDHLLRALGSNPWQIHKRLGDGYVEQDLVLDQVLQLTGRRTLDGGDGIAQYTALMDHAAVQARRLGLSLGKPLTATQVATLSSDIVWLVEQEVDGQAVLVPVVYLSKRTAGQMRGGGALIAGDNVHLKARGSVRNDGTIRGSGDTTIGADAVINTGALRAGERLGIATRGDTLNSGEIGGRSVTVRAGGSAVNTPRFDGLAVSGGRIAAGADGIGIVAAGDVVNQGVIRTEGNGVIVAGNDYVQDASISYKGTEAPAGSLSAAGYATVVAGRDAVFDRSSLDAGQQAHVNAGRDARFRAANVRGGTGVAIQAGQDIVSDTVTERTVARQLTKQRRRSSSIVTVDETTRGSTFASGSDLTIQAGHDIVLTATEANADGVAVVSAGKDINLLPGLSTTQASHAGRKYSRRHTYGSKTVHTAHQVMRSRVVGTALSGRAGVILDAGHDINTVGGTVRSDAGGIAVTAGHEVALHAAYDIDATLQSTRTRRAGFEHVPNDKQGTRKQKVQTQTVTPRGTTLDAAGPIVVASGGNQTYQAANIHSETGSTLLSGGAIHFQTASKTDTYQRASSKRNVAYQAKDARIRVGTGEVQSRITGPLTIAAAEGVTVDIGRDPRATSAQREAILRASFDNDDDALARIAIGESEDDAIARQAGQPGHAWIADLQGKPGVTWNLVDETHIDDHQHHEGVTKAAAAVITIVATAVTAGAASAAIGGTLGASSSTFAAATATTAAGAGTAAGIGNAVLTGAISGAVGGAVNAGSQGYDWAEGARKGALSGAVSGWLFHKAGSLASKYPADKASKYPWDKGHWQKTALHAGAGGTASVLTGGGFWNGAVSAGFSQAIGPHVEGLPGGRIGQAAGRAGAGAAGSWLNGGDAGYGALNGLAGYLFNEQLHPDAVHYLSKRAENYAREQCGCDPSEYQVSEARESLIRTAYRMGDTLYDRIASIQGAPFDETAASYVATHALGGLVEGEPVSYFSPDDARRGDASTNAYALYNDKTALAWVRQATGLHNDQMFYSLAATDYARHPQWLSQYADAVVKTSDASIYNTVGGTIFTGATAGIGTFSAPWVISATTGTRVGSIAQYLLVTRIGSGATNAAVNFASQAIQVDDNNPIRPTNVLFSFATGFAGVNGGFVWNVALNTAAGAANAQVNNWVYAGSDNSVSGAAIPGSSAALGYLVSTRAASVGSAARFQKLLPIVVGNAAGAGTTEWASWLANRIDAASSNREGNGE